jgi:anthranilate synthase component 1
VQQATRWRRLIDAAHALHERGERFALLDAPEDSPGAWTRQLCRLGEPTFGQPPTDETAVCLATFDHGLTLHDVDGRHEPDLGFELASFPVLDRFEPDDALPGTDATPDPTPLSLQEIEASHGREAFGEMVREAKDYIQRGHSYQVNLSLRLSGPARGNPVALFDRAREHNPSPYQSLLSTPEVTLVSQSPELLVDVQGDRLATRPIAGTRPRGATPTEDARMEAQLQRDAKEQAEHAMLVDLARNDLGKVARPGTVDVADDAVIERYRNVMHLVSEVRGRLREDRTAWDAFEAIFPCGTISGAPKRRSLEIVDELEPTSRGAYTGGLGLVTPDRSVWNILIRTLVLQNGRGHVQVGAGIVADSDPELEYEECLAKARSNLEALGREGPA